MVAQRSVHLDLALQIQLLGEVASWIQPTSVMLTWARTRRAPDVDIVGMVLNVFSCLLGPFVNDYALLLVPLSFLGTAFCKWMRPLDVDAAVV